MRCPHLPASRLAAFSITAPLFVLTLQAHATEWDEAVDWRMYNGN